MKRLLGLFALLPAFVPHAEAQCAAGKYTSGGACSTCAAGYFSTTGSSTGPNCAGILHEFDFRGCTTGVAVPDTFWPSMSLFATPFYSPTCSSTGVSFDGQTQYAQITSYNWGGITSFEVNLMYSAFNMNSRAFDFNNGRDANIFNLCNLGTISTLAVGIYEGGSWYGINVPNGYTLNVWSHIVVVSNGGTIQLYINGQQSTIPSSGITPGTLTRAYQYIGKSAYASDGYDKLFQGSIAFIRIFNNLALDSAAVTNLYNTRSSCKAGFYGSSDWCIACDAGMYTATAGATFCTECTNGFYSAASASICLSSCPAGSFHSGWKRCATCSAGTYTSSSGANVCSTCTAGYYSPSAGSSTGPNCAVTLHEFDFRGCTTGATVADTFWSSMALVATPFNGPTCSATGISFNGVNQYAQITSWSWGGDVTAEVYVMYSTFNSYSRVFDFADGQYADEFALACEGISSTLWYLHAVDSNSQYWGSKASFWTAGTWNHVVWTIQGSSSSIYLAGSIATSNSNFASPSTKSRSAQYVGRSWFSHDGYFSGSVAYIRLYNFALDSSAALNLYNARFSCKAGFYGTSGSCTACAAGTYTAIAGATSCTACSNGLFSAPAASTCLSACPAGSYTSLLDANACSACAAGHFSTTGSSSCAGCASGKYFQPSTSMCSACEAGRYQSDSGPTVTCLKYSVLLGNWPLDAQLCVGDHTLGPSTPGLSSYTEPSTGETSYTISDVCLTNGATFKPTVCSGGLGSNGYWEISGQGVRENSWGQGITVSPCENTSVYMTSSSSSGWSADGKHFQLEFFGTSTNGWAYLQNSASQTTTTVCLQPGVEYRITESCGDGFESGLSGAYLISGSPEISKSFSSCSSSQDTGVSFTAPTCTICPAGLFQPEDGSASCIACPAGQYSSAAGAKVCVTCSESGASSTVASSCVNCPAGTYADPNAECDCRQVSCGKGCSKTVCTPCTACKACVVGFFAPAEAATSCSSCSPGTVTSSAGASACTNCPAGTYADPNAECDCHQVSCGKGCSKTVCTPCTACKACVVGFFAPAEAATSCSSCSSGSVTTSTGASACVNCPAGTYADPTSECDCQQVSCGKGCSKKVCTPCTACDNCVAGQYSAFAAASSCSNCAAGYSSNQGASSCFSCPTGKTTVVSGSVECLSSSKCSAGQYGPSGSSTCADCAAGTHSQLGALACTICEAGYYSVASSSSCTGCAASQFSAAAGSSVCVKCNLDQYSAPTASACTTCPSGQFGSGSSCTTCASGQYQVSLVCSSCAAGTFSLSSGQSACAGCSGGTYSASTSTSCSPCAAGMFAASSFSTGCDNCAGGYSSSSGSSSCIACAAGTYSAAGDGSCSDCAAGTYSASSSTVSCTGCATGLYQPSAGLTTCLSCPVLALCSASAQYVTCPAGTYADSTAGACVSCLAGKYQAPGSTTCDDCQAGYYSAAGATACTSCGFGYFQVSAGRSSCTGCPAGTYLSSTGALATSACLNCIAGAYSASGASACSSCGVGLYQISTGQSACSSCRAGTFSASTGAASSATCSDCDAGLYSSSGVSACTSCGAGSYQASGGRSACINCQAGTSSSSIGAISASTCINCSSGSYSSSGVSACLSCGAGTYQSSSGQPTCSNCGAAGTSSSLTGAISSSACEKCVAGLYASASAASACSACIAGTFSTTIGSLVSTECSSCSAGRYSPAGSSVCAKCKKGSFAPTTAMGTCDSCPTGQVASTRGRTSCTPCTNAAWCNLAAGAAQGTCVLGQAGTACTECSKGYFMGVKSCLQCPPSGKYMLLFGIALLCFGLFVIYDLAGSKCGKRNYEKFVNDVKNLDAAAAESSAQALADNAAHEFVAAAISVFSHFQMISLYIGFHVGYPDIVLYIIGMMDIPFNLNFLNQVSSPQCSVGFISYQQAWLISALAPICCIILYVIVGAFSKETEYLGDYVSAKARACSRLIDKTTTGLVKSIKACSYKHIRDSCSSFLTSCRSFKCAKKRAIAEGQDESDGETVEPDGKATTSGGSPATPMNDAAEEDIQQKNVGDQVADDPNKYTTKQRCFAAAVILFQTSLVVEFQRASEIWYCFMPTRGGTTETVLFISPSITCSKSADPYASLLGMSIALFVFFFLAIFVAGPLFILEDKEAIGKDSTLGKFAGQFRKFVHDSKKRLKLFSTFCVQKIQQCAHKIQECPLFCIKKIQECPSFCAQKIQEGPSLLCAHDATVVKVLVNQVDVAEDEDIGAEIEATFYSAISEAVINVLGQDYKNESGEMLWFLVNTAFKLIGVIVSTQLPQAPTGQAVAMLFISALMAVLTYISNPHMEVDTPQINGNYFKTLLNNYKLSNNAFEVFLLVMQVLFLVIAAIDSGLTGDAKSSSSAKSALTFFYLLNYFVSWTMSIVQLYDKAQYGLKSLGSIVNVFATLLGIIAKIFGVFVKLFFGALDILSYLAGRCFSAIEQTAAWNFVVKKFKGLHETKVGKKCEHGAEVLWEGAKYLWGLCCHLVIALRGACAKGCGKCWDAFKETKAGKKMDKCLTPATQSMLKLWQQLGQSMSKLLFSDISSPKNPHGSPPQHQGNGVAGVAVKSTAVKKEMREPRGASIVKSSANKRRGSSLGRSSENIQRGASLDRPSRANSIDRVDKPRKKLGHSTTPPAAALGAERGAAGRATGVPSSGRKSVERPGTAAEARNPGNSARNGRVAPKFNAAASAGGML